MLIMYGMYTRVMSSTVYKEGNDHESLTFKIDPKSGNIHEAAMSTIGQMRYGKHRISTECMY